MAQVDELKTALQAIYDRVDTVAEAVSGLQGDVQALIDRLGDEDAPELPEVLTLVQGIQGKLDAIATDLDTTPKTPPEP